MKAKHPNVQSMNGADLGGRGEGAHERGCWQGVCAFDAVGDAWPTDETSQTWMLHTNLMLNFRFVCLL